MVAKQLTHKLILAGIFLLNIITIHANNIAVSNVSVTGQNTSAGSNNAANFSLVQFNLSWENSWRTATGPANWDAAWVFVKFRVGASNPSFTGVSSSGTTVTVSSTANVRVGMPLRVTSGTGAFAANTVISSIINATQFVVSATPTTQLSGAGIECIRIWEHARLNNTGHTAPSGSNIDVGLRAPDSAFNATTNPAVGVFIYRSTDGSGNNTFNNARLRWNYGANGINDTTRLTVQVFAIEMVLVPQSSFFVGSGGTESGSFTNGSWISGNPIPLQITSENALTIGQAAGNLWGTSSSGTNTIGAAGVLSASFPKGFGSFYCMKYEISQGQYRDFLNTLTRTQQANRVTMDGTVGRYTGGFTWNGSAWSGAEVNNLTTPANRNGLRLVADPGGITPQTYACDLNPSATLPTGVNQSDDGEWIAMNQLSWIDGCAYMDWAGLRPMTELEYEKACRGNQAAVSGEYAWGNATATSANNITNSGQAGEVTNTANANSASLNQSNVQGPLRVGAFAGAATTREQAGATFYGIMELSGSLWERAVTIGNSDGRSYTGAHGDGSLSTNGHANSTAWPGITSGEVTGASGSGFRGGGWSGGTFSSMRVSDRNGATVAVTTRGSDRGFRGVRTATNWAPNLLGSSLALWLDASDTSTITSATGVSEWRDKSGNGRHFGQTTANRQPAYVVSGINGLGSLSYDGVNDVIERASGSWGFEYPMTHFIVFRPISYNQPYNTLFEFYTDATGMNAGWGSLIKNNARSAVYMTSTGGQPNYDGNGSLTYPVNNNYIFSSTVGDSSIQSWGNGIADGAFTSTWTSRTNRGSLNFQIGATTHFNRFPTQQIGEVIILSSTASQATRQLVEGYLAWKWGIQASLPAGHPYKNRAP